MGARPVSLAGMYFAMGAVAACYQCFAIFVNAES